MGRMDAKVKVPTVFGVRQYVTLALIAVGGCLFVFLGVVAMNRAVTKFEEDNKVSVVNFIVPTKPAVPPPPPEPQPEQRIRRSSRPALAPVPQLGGGFSGISLALPDFIAGGNAAVSESLLGDLENVIMTEDAVDTLPIPQDTSWEYPERAKQRNIEGRIIVALHISVEGRVMQAEIVEADPPGVFDQAILAAAPGWTFIPAKYEGKGVATWVNLPIEASLN